MREYTDEEGKKVERILPNKLVETILVEPSQWYIDNKLKPAEAQRKRMDKIMKKEAKINRKMREMAIEALQQYECSECGYVYDPELGDPEHGIKPKTPWKELPQDWVCPKCGAGKNKFKKYEEE